MPVELSVLHHDCVLSFHRRRRAATRCHRKCLAEHAYLGCLYNRLFLVSRDGIQMLGAASINEHRRRQRRQLGQPENDAIERLLPTTYWIRDENAAVAGGPIAASSTTQEGPRHSHMSLQINGNYLDLYFQLSRRASHRLMTALKESSIASADFNLTHSDRFPQRRWLLLCRTLGQIPSLRKINITMGNSENAIRSAAMVIQQVLQMSHLELYQDGSGGQEGIFNYFVGHRREIARALERHDSLVSLKYCLSTNTYRHALPVLKNAPALQRIAFEPAAFGEVAAPDAQALAELLADSSFNYLAMRNLRFMSAETYQSLHTGLSASAIENIYVSNLHISEPGPFADALSASQVANLTLSNWPMQARNHLPLFLTALAQNLSTMNLVSLAMKDMCAALEGEGLDNVETMSTVQSVLPAVVRAAAACSTLQELSLPSAYFSEALDEALAHLVLYQDSRLQTLTIARPLQRITDVNCVSYPKLLEAMKQNVTLKCVELVDRPSFLLYRHVGQYYDPWCSDFRQNINILTRLNTMGREYLRSDAASQQQGLQVLEAVNDDLNCLLVHLRENPALCRHRSLLACASLSS